MALLEERGWLLELTAPIPPGLSARHPQNVLAVTSGNFDSVTAGEIFRQLEALIERVSGAIDES